MCDVKVVVERIHHRVGGDDGEVVRGVKRRTRVVAYCDGGDGRRMRREGKEESADGEGEEGNIVVAPGFYHLFQALQEAYMDLKGGRHVGERIGQKREGGCGGDSDGACGDSILLQTPHELHPEIVKKLYNQ